MYHISEQQIQAVRPDASGVIKRRLGAGSWNCPARLVRRGEHTAVGDIYTWGETFTTIREGAQGELVTAGSAGIVRFQEYLALS